MNVYCSVCEKELEVSADENGRVDVFGCCDRTAELAALRERVKQLEWVVKKLEYVEEYPDEEMLCPICRGEKPTHYEDCELAAALRGEE